MSLLSGLKAAVSKVCTRSGEKVIHQAKSVLICPSTYTTVFAPLENTYNEGHTFPIFSAEKCWSMALLWYNQSIMYFSYNTLYFPRSGETNGCSVSITYMRNITMYVDLISNTYKEYSWRSKTFWMPLFSQKREFLILFKGIFSYCIISGKTLLCKWGL